MSKVLAIATTAAALMAASPSFAQDKTSNTFGAASFEAVPQGYGSYPAMRQVRVPTSPRNVITIRTRESGASKRG